MDDKLEKLDDAINELIKNVLSRNEYIQQELLTALSDKSVHVSVAFAKDAEQEAIKLSGELNAYEKVKMICEKLKKEY